MGGPVHNVHVNGVHDSRVRFSDAERMDSKMKGQRHAVPAYHSEECEQKGTSVPFASAPPSEDPTTETTPCDAFAVPLHHCGTRWPKPPHAPLNVTLVHGTPDANRQSGGKSERLRFLGRP